MSDLDKTMKIRAFSPDAKTDISQDNLKEEQKIVLELSKKTAQLEEEKAKTLEFGKVIEQLRKSLKEEQTKSAELAKKLSEHESGAKEMAEALRKISTIATDATRKNPG